MNDLSNLSTAIGLILDILGFAIIFVFGVPRMSEIPNETGEQTIIMEQPDKEERDIDSRRVFVNTLLSYTGAVLLMLGFVLQLIPVLARL